MPRSRRTKVLAILDEFEAVVLNVPSRVAQGGGVLPEAEDRAFMLWIGFVTVVVGEGRGVDPETVGSRLNFYATEGLNARRPGAPEWLVPSSGLRDRLRRAIAAMVGEG
jgi:hypothetical protein